MAESQEPLTAVEIEVWCLDLDQPVGALAGLLSPDETERAGRYGRELERNRFVYARGAVRTILGEHLGVPGAQLEFAPGSKGKPSLHHPCPGFEFNLTHCEGMALLALSQDCPVGVDLEYVRSRPAQMKIARRLFTRSVQDELASLPTDQLAAAFTRSWTEYEARAKCLGAGIFSTVTRNEEISTCHFTPQPGWIACVAGLTGKGGFITLKHLNFML
jgi:4'-phosphopantetheinyl transferase